MNPPDVSVCLYKLTLLAFPVTLYSHVTQQKNIYYKEDYLLSVSINHLIYLPRAYLCFLLVCSCIQ